MVQLCILSGKTAGKVFFVRRFPFRIGRSDSDDLRLDDSGIWEAHLTMGFKKNEGFILQTAPEAFAAVNEQPQTSTRLRNGDIISFGSAKIQFWLAPARFRGLCFREGLVWVLLVVVTAVQAALIYALRR